MKRILTTAFLVFTYTALQAQSFLSVNSFRSAPDDFTASAMQTRRESIYGTPCALVKIDTRLTGLSFDAGRECISDVVYSDSGVWLYVPAGTRTITISHAQAGTLRSYNFPLTLESGRTYEMSLRTQKPKSVKPVKPFKYKPPKPRMCIDGFSTHFVQSHIGMMVDGGGVDDVTLGVSYSFMPGRMGLYTSVDWCPSCGVSFFAGPSIRLLDSKTSATDWQLYAAAGVTTEGAFGADWGTRFGWKSDKLLSRYDFSIGCQYWGGKIFVPYVGFGAKISAYTAGAAVGLILLAALSVL